MRSVSQYRPAPWLWAFIVAALLALGSLPFIHRGGWVNIAVLVLIYAAAAQAWNILGGFGGQISLGNAVFLGIGAYTSTLLLIHWSLTPWLGLLAGAVVAAAFGVLIGFPVFRLGGHYFAIATIAVGEIVVVLFTNWSFAGGAVGLTIPFARDAGGRPADSWYYLQFNQTRAYYVFVALAILALVTAVTIALEQSKIGFYLRAIKNDQEAARTLGVHVLRYKLIAIALSAGFTAVVGSIYANYLLFIDPGATMRLQLSILIALVAILGGVSTVLGPLIGALVMIPLSELTRSRFGGSGGANDLILYGALVVVISVFQPNGLIGLAGRLRGRGTRPPRETATDREEEAYEEAPLFPRSDRP